MVSEGPVVAALLLVCALVGAAGPVGGTGSQPIDGPTASHTAQATAPAVTATPVVPRSNTTAILTLTGATERSGFATAGLDVASAMAADGAELQSRYTRFRAAHRFEMAETPAERRAAVATSADRVASRVAELRRREEAARAAYAEGALSAGTYLRRTAVHSVAARELEDTTTVLGRQADATGDVPVSTARVARIRADLIGLKGPVRERVGGAAAGTRGPVRVSIHTDGPGIVLAALGGDAYVRSAHVPGARNESLPNQFTTGSGDEIDAAEARARELYPWAFEHRTGSSVGLLVVGPPLQLADVYTVTVNHPQGTVRQSDLVAYLDGGTTDAFREIQYLSVESLPTQQLGQTAGEDLTLAVAATHADGPVRVTVTDPAGEPVDATVLVNGERVGAVGADGQRWILAPRGSVNVTAVASGESVTVTGTV